MEFRTATLCAVLAALAAGCGLAEPDVGAPVPGVPGVAEARFELRVRSTDVLPVHVYFPAEADGRPRREGGGRAPGLVLVQGGFVEARDYRDLAARLAAGGRVVAVPEHGFDLALLALDNGRFARELLERPPAGSLLEGWVEPGRVAVAGHSLGGVVATKLALQGGWRALVLLASYPDDADADALAHLGRPSLTVAGEADCRAPVERVVAHAQLLPSPSVLATLAGVSHYQFTDSDAPDRHDAGCAPGIALELAHARIAAVADAFLRAADAGDPGLGVRELEPLEGVRVSVR